MVTKVSAVWIFRTNSVRFLFVRLDEERSSLQLVMNPPPFRTPFKRPSRSAYCPYKLPECYLSPRLLLYARCGHPRYNMMDTFQTDSSVSWFKCTHISEIDPGNITNFKVRLNSQSNCNFSPCRSSSIGTAIEHFFGKVNLVEPELEGDVSAAPFGDGCKKGI